LRNSTLWRAPFRYSGAPYYQRVENTKFEAFFAETGIDIEAGCGIDTTVHQDGWKQVSILTEIACCEFPALGTTQAAQGELDLFTADCDGRAA